MEEISYSFGLGDGDVTTWLSSADLDLDGDGIPDAVSLDFDGDGFVDDAMWDSDGDGIADTVVLNVPELGADGPERFFVDPEGIGTWAVETTASVPPTAPAPPPPGPLVAVDPAFGPVIEVDTDGDGIPDTRLRDADGDGRLDAVEAM